LEKGTLLRDGKPDQVMDYYNALISQKEEDLISETGTLGNKLQVKSGNGKVRIVKCGLFSGGEAVDTVSVGQPLTLRVVAKASEMVQDLVFGFCIKDRLGQDIFGTNTYHLNKTLDALNKDENITFDVSFSANFGVGSYSISVALHKNQDHLNVNYEWLDLASTFVVYNNKYSMFVGNVWLECDVEMRKSETSIVVRN
jgi:lipopolysaccharide transport system ATP-binding protein